MQTAATSYGNLNADPTLANKSHVPVALIYGNILDTAGATAAGSVAICSQSLLAKKVAVRMQAAAHDFRQENCSAAIRVGDTRSRRSEDLLVMIYRSRSLSTYFSTLHT